jgi:hypothetical protein
MFGQMPMGQMGGMPPGGGQAQPPAAMGGMAGMMGPRMPNASQQPPMGQMGQGGQGGQMGGMDPRQMLAMMMSRQGGGGMR